MDGNTLNFRRSMAVLWRRRVFIVATTLLGVSLAVVYTTAQPHVYSASARVVVQSMAPDPTDPLATQIDPLGADIDTQVEVVQSGTVSERVARTVGSAALSSASVTVRALTLDALEVEAQSPNPVLSAHIANAFVASYIEFRRDSVRQAVQVIGVDIDERIRSFEARIAQIDQDVAALSEDPGQGTTIAALTSEQENLTGSIGSLRAKKAGLQASAAEAEGSAGQIIQRATPPDGPSAPVPSRDITIGLVLGIVLGIGLAFLMEQIKPRILSRDDAAHATGAPVLSIPRGRALVPRGSTLLPARAAARQGGRSESDARSTGSDHASAADVPLHLRSPRWEAYRALRANLSAHGLGDHLRRLVVVAPEPNREVSDVVTGLAAACAMSGHRTTIVATDVRNRDLDRLVGTLGKPGLSEVVSGQSRVATVLQRTVLDRLSVLPSGDPGQVLGDPLSSPLLPGMFEELGSLTNIVVIGSAPASRGADATILTGMGDGVVLVIAAGRTTEAALRQTVDMTKEAGVPVLGVMTVKTGSGRTGRRSHAQDRQGVRAETAGAIPIGHAGGQRSGPMESDTHDDRAEPEIARAVPPPAHVASENGSQAAGQTARSRRRRAPAERRRKP
jgi:Mrp family chromosome partitioning ATPase/capsular polysaccharide biosynthesis protein